MDPVNPENRDWRRLFFPWIGMFLLPVMLILWVFVFNCGKVINQNYYCITKERQKNELNLNVNAKKMTSSAQNGFNLDRCRAEVTL